MQNVRINCQPSASRSFSRFARPIDTVRAPHTHNYYPPHVPAHDPVIRCMIL